jgi:hypothetical protein
MTMSDVFDNAEQYWLDKYDNAAEEGHNIKYISDCLVKIVEIRELRIRALREETFNE